jgi:hypothetical protein
LRCSKRSCSILQRSSKLTFFSLGYDALGRLSKSVGSQSGTTQFLYDGRALIGEYDGAGTLTRRVVHRPGTDEPIVVYNSVIPRILVYLPRALFLL